MNCGGSSPRETPPRNRVIGLRGRGLTLLSFMFFNLTKLSSGEETEVIRSVSELRYSSRKILRKEILSRHDYSTGRTLGHVIYQQSTNYRHSFERTEKKILEKNTKADQNYLKTK